jgi:hypothetical protein
MAASSPHTAPIILFYLYRVLAPADDRIDISFRPNADIKTA